jgi:cobalt-precorrin 5A hydrolase
MIAAGLGCRSGCADDDLLLALDGALAAAGCAREALGGLYAPEEKRDEPGLLAAAARLGKPLVLLPRAALLAHGAATITHSAYALAHYGVPSVAETAALAGAALLGAHAEPRAATHGRPRLLGPRQVAGSATCALAITEEK